MQDAFCFCFSLLPSFLPSTFFCCNFCISSIFPSYFLKEINIYFFLDRRITCLLQKINTKNKKKPIFSHWAFMLFLIFVLQKSYNIGHLEM